MKRENDTSRDAEKGKQSEEKIEYSGHAELQATEIGLIGYSTDIVRKLSGKMNLTERFSTQIEVLEFGAGSGFLADIWKSVTHISPDCCEIDPILIQAVRTRGFICYPSLSQVNKKYQGIYTSNVLEHIENDSAILKELYDLLIPGGVLGIYVPAFPSLFSEMDEAVGHFRRYRRAELISKVQGAGFQVEMCNYSDFLGFFASIVLKLLGFKKRTNIGSAGSLKFYDTWIYPISRTLDALGFRKLLGKNLLLIAKRVI